MLSRLARWCVRHKFVVVLGIWVPLFIALGVASSVVGSNFHTQMQLPNGEARDVFTLLESVSKEEAGFDSQIVVKAPQGVANADVQASLAELFAKVDQIDGIKVVSPYDQPKQQINADGTIAYAQLKITGRTQTQFASLATEIEGLGDKAIARMGADNQIQLEYGGQAFRKMKFPASEALGIIAAVVILVLAFGSVLAMGLPIGTALIGLGLGSSIVGLLSNVGEMPDFTTQMVAMIGLGVGIDYALFIVTRYREALHDGLSVEDSIVEAVDTSGRAVLFAGITVIISLLGLYIMGLSFVRGLATGAAVGVLMMMIASVTLLPALLAMAGHRINVTSRAAMLALGLLVAGGLGAIVTSNAGILLGGVALAVVVLLASLVVKSLRQPIPHRAEKSIEQGFWYRWSRFIQHRPWPVFLFGAGVLVVLTLPLFSIRLGFGDNGNAKPDQTIRRAYDLLAEGFGPGFNGPLVVTIEGANAAKPEVVQQFAATLRGTPGVQAAFARPIRADLALVTVIPKSAPQDVATTDLVHRLRQHIIPDSGLTSRVGGFTAASQDFSEYLGARLPVLIGAVLILSFLLLMAVFRSLLVPLKAVIMNLLSIGAAYGVVVAVFQWGWGKNIIGVGKPGPVEAWAPMMLFAIVFGLSMDYEVFLLSRMKEEFDRTGDNATAVADGLAVTARVITAAALIMVCVFSAFILGDDRQLKLFGLGLASAVFIDATVVRMLLVPATMELLGARNWWLPNWLDRLLPKINVEGHRHEEVMPELVLSGVDE
ncbi:MAG: MMPL family transporter [Actinomycetota bacterium]|jgi:RND superfamily putative drug exporter